MLPKKWSALIFTACTLALYSCGGGSGKQENPESATKGNITISVEEGLRPVMEQQLKVWDSAYPEGHITVHYLPENECFDELYQNKSRLIVTSRDITPKEKETYAASKIVTQSLAVAEDAIAVVLNPSSPDTLMTVGQLKAIFEGTFARPYTVVFDNGKSSIVHYVLDSLISGGKLSSKSYAAGNNKAVIEYVAKNPGSLGIVGVGYAYDPEDNSGAGKFLSNVKIAALQDEATGQFHKPYQYAIALHRYPLTRKVYFISRETWQGLGTGFANFLSQQQGQLIFKKAWMVPLRVPLEVQEVEIK